jgi:NADPH:quinone reductase-like Zn-dependent oxidoreductase
MKAMVIKAFGGPEVFEQREVPKPMPSPKHVLVRVMATSVNPLDYQIRRGDYKAYVKLPAILGSDVSGIIEAVGDGVTNFKVGDQVYYTPQIFNGDGSIAIQLAKARTRPFISSSRNRAKLDQLRSLIERERIRPVIDSQMPLSEVARAHERIEQGGVRGKIVLDAAG